MKKFINEKADINNPKWNNLIHREKEIYKRENDLRSDFERDYNRKPALVAATQQKLAFLNSSD